MAKENGISVEHIKTNDVGQIRSTARYKWYIKPSFHWNQWSWCLEPRGHKEYKTLRSNAGRPSRYGLYTLSLCTCQSWKTLPTENPPAILDGLRRSEFLSAGRRDLKGERLQIGMFPNTSKTPGIFLPAKRRSRIQWSSAAVSISLCHGTVSSEHEEQLWNGVTLQALLSLPTLNFVVKNSQKYIWERQSEDIMRFRDVSTYFLVSGWQSSLCLPGCSVIRYVIMIILATGASPAAMS